MLLPGQSRHASKRLTGAISEVQAHLERPIVFLDLKGYSNSLMRKTVRGFHDRAAGMERIWLDADMPYSAQEATAAHELAHIVQKLEAYPQAISFADADRHSLIPQFERLAARINSLIMDESADLWAISRGFDMGKALRNTGLEALLGLLNHQPAEAEAADWDEYHARLEKLSRKIKTGKSAKPSFETGPEVNTVVMALDYAGLSLRLGRYGLFKGLDRLWAGRWPASRALGKELAEVVRKNGVESREKGLKTLKSVISCLRIPSPLISIR